MAAACHLLLLLAVQPLQCSPVLLVDTVKPGWPVLHANSSWHKLLQQRQQASMTSCWVESGNSHSSHSNSHHTVGQLLWPILAEQLNVRSSGAVAAAEQQQQQLWAAQVQQLVAERQCFTLAGLQLPGLGSQPVSLCFRWVRTIVPLCEPAFAICSVYTLGGLWSVVFLPKHQRGLFVLYYPLHGWQQQQVALGLPNRQETVCMLWTHQAPMKVANLRQVIVLL
jgi:hypothetical protein